MKRLFVMAVMALSAGPALAQSSPVPRYGDVDKAKSPAEIERDRAAEAAYKKSLGNVPNAGPVDPWGGVRSDGPSKSAAKPTPAKKTKSSTPAN